MLDAGHTRPCRGANRVVALGMRQHPASQSGGLVHDGPQLILGQLLDARHAGGEHRRLAGHGLDDPGAITDVATYRGAKRQLPIRLDAEPPAMAAGDGQRETRRDEPRARDVARFDGLCEWYVQATWRTSTAGGGDARGKCLSGGSSATQHDERVGVTLLGLEHGRRRGVQDVVGVTVDRDPAAVSVPTPGCAGRRCPGPDGAGGSPHAPLDPRARWTRSGRRRPGHPCRSGRLQRCRR